MDIWGTELAGWAASVTKFYKKIKNVISIVYLNFFCFFQELENRATGGNQFFPRIFFKRVIFLIFRLKVFYSNGHYLKTCKKSKFHENSIRSEKKVSSRNDQTWLNKNGCKASLASPPGGENENECWNTLASSNLCNIYTFKIVFIVRESKLRSF